MKINVFLFVLITVIAVNGQAQGDQPQENLEYRTVTEDGVACDVGVLYKNVPGGQEVTIAAMAVGEGADFRKWEITDIKLKSGNNLIRAAVSDKFYGAKESVFRRPAAVAFAAIGSQYERYSSSCSSGGVCPVTGEPAGGETGGQGKIARGIDKAGMAAGLGLLTAQAKGEITGEICVFNVTDEAGGKVDAVNLVVENKEKHKKYRLTIPLSGASGAFSGLAEKHPGMEHLAGTAKGGTFIVTSEDQAEPPQEGTLPSEKPESGTQKPVYFKDQLMTENDLAQQAEFSRSKLKLLNRNKP
ncbi:MAG: hypothetical protein ABIA77_05945 [Candidatus Omnitrophota bacterium]